MLHFSPTAVNTEAPAEHHDYAPVGQPSHIIRAVVKPAVPPHKRNALANLTPTQTNTNAG
jgi:hypothetical protein